MSTGTSQEPVAAQPVPTRRRTALVGIVAAVSVVATLALVYSSMEVNGADLSDPRGWILIVIVSVVPGLLAAWAVSLGVAARGRRRPRLAVLAPVGVLLMMGAVTGMAVLGGRSYDANQTNIATACSSQKVAVLEQFRQYGSALGPAEGQQDGTCAIFLIYPGEDAQSVMATLVGNITAGGWVTADTAWDQKSFGRDGEAVQVTHYYSEDGQTAIRIVALDR